MSDPASTSLNVAGLAYEELVMGRDFWVIDDVLADPDAVRARNLDRRDWLAGFPYRPEMWPGLRAADALEPDELASLQDLVLRCTGARRLDQGWTPPGERLDHNSIQLVGQGESGPRPHTDSRRLCRYAAVLYLSPAAPPDAGTSFYRLLGPEGALGGNRVREPYANLVEALGVSRLPLQAWAEDLRVENRYNRLVLYRGDLVHSATRYFGVEPRDRRLTAVFFWMADF
jgi:Family of unknown function (DUF6445)